MKKNKSLIILILVLTIGIVGLTIAYFSNSTSVDNQFTTQPYGTTVEESFISPSNWLPGDTTPKTVTVTNSGQVDEAVRISLSETWTPNNANAILNGWIHADGTKSTHTSQEELANDERVAVINFDNTSDWTYNNGYYYYNYKLSPNETTSSLIKSVTFNSKTKLDDTCTETITSTGKTITCNSSGNDYDNATYNLVFTVETVQYNKYQEAWNTNVAIAKSKPMILQQFVAQNTNASNAEYNASTKGKMFQFTHTVNNQTVNETRYIGNDPNNYVYFNCDEPQEGVEYNYANSCEVWRILGTFDVQRTVEDPENAGQNITITETRMKLVRGTDLATARMWDNRNSEQYTSGNYGKNDWNGSLMQTFLMGDYYNRTGEAASNGLKLSARGMIDDAIFYLGGFPWSSSDTTYNAEKIYEMERGTEVYSERPTRWEGKVALMYPSDMYMTYAKTDGVGCYNQPMHSIVCGHTNGEKSWIFITNKLEGSSIYQSTWFLSPDSSNSRNVYCAGKDILNCNYGNKGGGVRPVVYLKSDIQIIDGDGTSENPYKLQ